MEGHNHASSNTGREKSKGKHVKSTQIEREKLRGRAKEQPPKLSLFFHRSKVKSNSPLNTTFVDSPGRGLFERDKKQTMMFISLRVENWWTSSFSCISKRIAVTWDRRFACVRDPVVNASAVTCYVLYSVMAEAFTTGARTTQANRRSQVTAILLDMQENDDVRQFKVGELMNIVLLLYLHENVLDVGSMTRLCPSSRCKCITSTVTCPFLYLHCKPISSNW